MTKITISRNYRDKILENRFLVESAKAYMDACQRGQEDGIKYLEENPDFVQTVMNAAKHPDIVVEES